MNIIKKQDYLRGADDQTLARYLANPTGEYPGYLVASEIERRNEMREKYAQETQGRLPSSSIIEEMIQKAGLGASPDMNQQPTMQAMQPQFQGIGAVPVPENMKMTPPPMMGAVAQNMTQEQPVQNMYDGGIVALKSGGVPGYKYNPDDYAINPEYISPFKLPAEINQEAFLQKAKEQAGPGSYEGFEDALNQRQQMIDRNKQNYLSDFLIRSGLGMASSKSPLPFQAAAEGASQGFDFYQKSKEADNLAAQNLADARFKFKAAERAERLGLMGIAQANYNAAVGQVQNAHQLNQSAEKLRLQGQHYGDVARLGDEELQIKRIGEANRAGERALQREILKDTREEKREQGIENRKQRVLNTRVNLLKEKREFEEAFNSFGSPYQKQIQQLGKMYSGVTLDRAVAQLKDKAWEEWGGKELESALLEYQK